MNISEAARLSGVSARMIRHYESIGLVPKPGRTQGGYRDFSEIDIRRLVFIRRARDLGFSLDQLRVFLPLWDEESASADSARTLADRHISELKHRVSQLLELIDTIENLNGASGKPPTKPGP